MADNPRSPLSNFPAGPSYDNSDPLIGPHFRGMTGDVGPFQSTTTDTNQDTVETTIERILGRQASKKIDLIVEKLQKDITQQQSLLFFILAAKIIGVNAPPDLGQYTPPWTGLTLKYVNYRFRKFGTSFSSFYTFRSDTSAPGRNLRDMLNSANPFTVFGKPLVTKVQTTVGGTKRWAVAISPFPKVTTDLITDSFDEKDYFKASNRAIAWRLRNWRGGMLRPIMRNYMLWWMEVVLKDTLRRSTNAK